MGIKSLLSWRDSFFISIVFLLNLLKVEFRIFTILSEIKFRIFTDLYFNPRKSILFVPLGKLRASLSNLGLTFYF